MEPQIIKLFIDYGIAGAVILALFWLIKYILGNHKAERKEWRHEANNQQDQTRKVISELTDVIRDINNK